MRSAAFLSLRQLLESNGAMVVGSVGLLIRGYRDDRLDLDTLKTSIDDLLERSTLHLSQAFRSYVRQLVEELP